MIYLEPLICLQFFYFFTEPLEFIQDKIHIRIHLYQLMLLHEIHENYLLHHPVSTYGQFLLLPPIDHLYKFIYYICD